MRYYRVSFLAGPPLKYKIPLNPLALREISEQLTWDLVLKKIRGGPVKNDTL